ncbi:hypothetical protein CHS0354_019502 [Potamilus streckersoni]|uniref:Uncharacterized protein n=1 Tax=Potamilus streckersoni TaxID=2493646 RepID=A0AAE0SGY6_9BIVA|nr:hypothetical protein CHS0354_019502 [Potamilus streckersoni]
MLNEMGNCNRTPIHHAAASGNVVLLSYLIDSGTEPWCRSSLEETLLHRACIHSKLEITKYLVEIYPKILHEVAIDKRTPAHDAAAGGNVAVLSFLIDCGADSWCRTSEEETLLHRACIHGKLEMTKYLVETYPKMLHEVDKGRRTAVLKVAASGYVAVLAYVIECGTDPGCKTFQEETLLHRACIKGKVEMTKYLADTYPKMLYEVDNCNKTSTHHAAAGGNVAVFRYLIDRGTDPWCRTSQEETPMHSACINEKYPKMLHEVDNSKRTSAHHAEASGNIAVLTYLINCGSDPWCRTFEEEMFLHISCINGKLEMTKYLVETYPKMLQEVANGKRTPAQNAAATSNGSVLCYLRDTEDNNVSNE